MADPGRAAYERLMRDSEAQGPCSCCGGPRARHRLWDSVDAAVWRRGRTYREIQREFRVGRREVDLVAIAYRWARQHHRPLPGRALA